MIRKPTAFAIYISIATFTVPLFGKVINVPADQPTIQAGIDGASDGDTVLVAPGTYRENINFKGKAITVKSTSGRASTTIEAASAGSVVTFNSGESLNSVLNGFTLRNGGSPEGGGVLVSSASPTITYNRMIHNSASGPGGGIAIVLGSPVIKNNRIINNFGFEGGAISVRGASTAKIIGNEIHNNLATAGGGGGIALDGAGAPLIQNNQLFEM